jgi:hypothetical protein
VLGRARLAAELAGDHEGVGVADHRLATERGEPVEHLCRLGAALGNVAEADDAVDSDPLDVVDDRAERDVVSVLVGDERDPRHAQKSATLLSC